MPHVNHADLGHNDLLRSQLQNHRLQGAELLAVHKLTRAQPPVGYIAVGHPQGSAVVWPGQCDCHDDWSVRVLVVTEELIFKGGQFSWAGSPE